MHAGTLETNTLLRKLKPIMASLAEAVCTRFGKSCEEAWEAYQHWQSLQLYPPTELQDEFCLQTTCMQFVGVYFLRICEEYGLLLPYPTGNLKRKTWLTSSMQYAQSLLNLLDGDASAHFARCFDWFAPDEQRMLQLYHLLRRYSLTALHDDMPGKVYNEGFIVQRSRSEKGQYYTPSRVVNYMLDAVGMPAFHENTVVADDGYTKWREFLSKTVADLSCGSGSFLVAVAARKRAMLQQLIDVHAISRDDACHILINTIVGFDLNPFACYLTTVNLLVQCLPLLLDEQGRVGKRLGRFHIHCADALDPRGMERSGVELDQFDYLVGNPPYVSAHESSSNLSYREKIQRSGHYKLLNQKWDVFVPFFERNLQLLRPETGRLGLIVSSSIETEGYAGRLRQTLCAGYRLLQIDFFPGLRVFQHIGIETTIVCLEKHAPGDAYLVTRRRHFRANLTTYETLPPVRQLAGAEQIFRWRYWSLSTISMAKESIPLCAIAYIGTGIEAQSSEYTEQLIDGQRHKRFTLSDVFVAPTGEYVRPDGYPDDGVLGDDVDYYYVRRTRFVAYEQYRPFMRAPRHISLFRTPEKLLLGETSGGYYDTAGLFANHSVQVVVPWHALEQVGATQQTGIQRVLRKSQKISATAELAQVSQQFDLRYVLAIVNSRFMRRYIASNLHQGTRKGRIYPDVWKRLPIKIVSLEQQRHIALLVESLQEEYSRLARLGEIEEEKMLARAYELIGEIETLVETIYGQGIH